MTQKQNYLYWREWAAVRRVDAGADRHALHASALGEDKSHKDFSNAEFDKVLQEFRAISQPANLAAQLRQINQPKTRLIFKIRQLADEPYIQALLESPRFKASTLEELDEKTLTDFRNTCAARRSSRNRKIKHSPETLADTEDVPVNHEGVMVPF